MAQVRGEDPVAFVDDELGVADEMSQANLMLFRRPPRLRAVAVGDPDVGAKGPQELLDDGLASSRAAHEIGVVAVMEHPQPPAPLADAKSRFRRSKWGFRPEDTRGWARWRS
jgi:hypothetical protein